MFLTLFNSMLVKRRHVRVTAWVAQAGRRGGGCLPPGLHTEKRFSQSPTYQLVLIGCAALHRGICRW